MVHALTYGHHLTQGLSLYHSSSQFSTIMHIIFSSLHVIVLFHAFPANSDNVSMSVALDTLMGSIYYGGIP